MIIWIQKETKKEKSLYRHQWSITTFTSITTTLSHTAQDPFVYPSPTLGNTDQLEEAEICGIEFFFFLPGRYESS